MNPTKHNNERSKYVAVIINNSLKIIGTLIAVIAVVVFTSIKADIQAQSEQIAQLEVEIKQELKSVQRALNNFTLTDTIQGREISGLREKLKEHCDDGHK